VARTLSTNKQFTIDMQVRDYECDMQGIVNNAIYQNYLEWARHKYLRQCGLDFADLTARGIIVVVIRAEIDYCKPLRSGSQFSVSVTTRRASRLKLVFEQEIRLLPDAELVASATITTTCINPKNRPYFHPDLEALL
jgi:acyl-CoA thioester hydrolase